MPLINASNLSDFIAMNDLHFVRDSKNLYWYFDQDAKTWKPVSKTGVEQLPVIAESKNPKERTLVDFYDIMKRQNREIDGVYRGLDERNGLLNLFVRGSWLKPIIDQTHEAHPIFDILMTSLAGGRQEVKDRIEQCLLHKIFFPEEIAVPTLVMYGQGGVGKGLFYNVCHAIFGKNTVSVEHSRIFTDRNSIIEGKVIIYLDDFQANQKETDDIKKIVYNREFVTRAEYNAAVTNQNMTWWFISHNYADRPPVILQGDISEGADRRWFVVKHKDGQTLHYWISQSPDYKLYRDSGRFKTTVEYFSDRKPILDDDVAISHWLGSLVVKHGEPVAGKPPEAIYGNDYHQAVTESSSCVCEPHERLAEVIFSTGYFDKMDVDALFKFYQENIAGTKYKSTSNFGKFLTQYVVCHGNLKDIWAKNDDHRVYWYRKVNDGIDRPSIMLAFDKVTGNLPEVMEDYYQNSSHRSEEAPVDWDDQYADIDLPNYQESSAKRRKWFDTVRVEAQARHQLAITALKKRDRGFAAEDYLKVVLLQNKVGFGNFIKHVEKFYQYKLRTEAVTTKTLQGCHLIFLEALANDIDTYKTKYEDIWSADTCIQWLDHRDVTEIDKFLGTVITTLLKFQKNDGD